MPGLGVGYGELCHRFDLSRRAHQQFNWRGRRPCGRKLYQRKRIAL